MCPISEVCAISVLQWFPWLKRIFFFLKCYIWNRLLFCLERLFHSSDESDFILMWDHLLDSLTTLFLLTGGLCPVGILLRREKVAGSRRYKAVILAEQSPFPPSRWYLRRKQMCYVCWMLCLSGCICAFSSLQYAKIWRSRKLQSKDWDSNCSAPND